MSNKVLLICDDNVLCDLYKLNLEVYTDVLLSICESNREALKVLKEQNDFQCILATPESEGDVGLSAIIESLKEDAQFIPIVQIGQLESEQTDGVQLVPSAYNIKHILQTVAKMLGITAKSMAKKKVDKYYPIPINMINDVEKCPCDLFSKHNVAADEYEFKKLLSEGDILESKITQFKANEIDIVYVDAVHRLKIVNLMSNKILQRLSAQDLGDNERLSLTEQGMEVVSANLFDNDEITKEIAELTNSCVDSSKALAKSMPELSSLLSALMNNKAGFAFQHSILNTYVANHMIKKVSWGGDNHTDKLNFVLFFHDIFLVPLFNNHPDATSEEQLLYSGELNDKEKELLLSHASLAQNALRNYPKCPIGADAIIAQHHGTTNGIGFAANFKDDISPLAKVVIIAEDFVHRFLDFKNANQRDVFPLAEALAEMKEIYSKSSYKKLIDTLDDIPL